MRSFASLLLCAFVASSRPAAGDDFWAHWGDGKAELNGYRLVQPRYGAKRIGSAVLIFVTEDMSDSARVKADPGKHPTSDVYPVLKLNTVRDFQTGIYDYNVMTSVFARVSAGWPVAKVSFSSQEWCGHVYHQLLPRAGQIESVRHSYFDGEADARETIEMPKDGVLADALPILLRGWGTELMKAGEQRTLPYLPTLMRTRLEHKPLAWGRATLKRQAALGTVAVPAGKFAVVIWTVAQEGGPTTTYAIEAESPHRVVRWSADDGEDAELLGSERLAYWKLNQPGGESALRALGLKPASALLGGSEKR
jgi:hypothetical protein